MVNRANLCVYLPFLVAVCALLGEQANGQWDKKPYQLWTMEEVEKILVESPWAQTPDLGIVSRGDNPLPDASVIPAAGSMVIRLRSALPVRQALARLRQLKSKYDKMSDRDKAVIDEKNKILLECLPCDENYVVALSPGPGGQKGVPSVLKTMSLAEARLNVEISNERGEKRELVHFAQPRAQGDEAVFFFARFNEKGEPLLTPQTRRLIVSLGHKIFSTSPTPRTNFTFEVSKMILNGQVMF